MNFATITLKKWLKRKSVVAERFIRTLKNRIYQHMPNDIVDKYKNTYHRTIKIKPIELGDDSFTEYNEETNEKDPKFKVGYHVRISMYKNIFAKGYTPNWSEGIFAIKKNKRHFTLDICN